MRRQAGMTLVELVITIVIIGIAAAALFSAQAAIVGRSADPLLRQQSLAIAEAYLEEILLQPFVDSGGAVCPAPPASRASFDNVCDYHGLNDNGARDARGQAIAALASYRVQVAVTPQAWAGLAASDALLVRVTVTDPAGQQLQLDGYRARY
ncbi:prepilin-type N-terminal cleavage/methylation domain-containing protein [Pseudomonas sp. CAU 1711]|uniref:prepilin-type N-terminal cleavage/methylation domain-containing protein n=1 Tax=Pseudomonas sp. CAU 1711 TaxID=3140356 RepID=UPI0032609C95